MEPFGNQPLSNREAWEVYAALLRDFRIWQRRDEPLDLERLWHEFASRDTASPKLWMDAYLAAFAVAGGYRLVTFDKAFSQFSKLDLELL
jgi:predicted nucleic acid-binding protein